MSSKELLGKGEWDNAVSWELYASNVLPPSEQCTAAFCVAITDNDRIVLMKARRGWGMLGGHKEKIDVSLPDTARRESQEEGGFTPDVLHLFGYRKITSVKPIISPDGTTPYPFPDSYIVYYWSKSALAITEPTGEEVLDSASFTMDELRASGDIQIPDLPIIEAGWQAYMQTQ